MSSKRLLTLFCALFLSLGLLAVPASAVETFTGGASQGTFAAKPAAPTVTISNVASSGKIRLTWNAVSGASSYQVYRSTSKNGTYKLVKTATGTSFTNTGAVAGKTYYYYVVAVAKDGTQSAKSAIKSRTCDLAQPKPTIALNAKGQPTLKWEAVSGAVSYKVYRATSENGSYSVMKTTTGTSYTNTTAEEGKTYYYKVRAICENTDGNSAYSAVLSIKAGLATAPVDPPAENSNLRYVNLTSVYVYKSPSSSSASLRGAGQGRHLRLQRQVVRGLLSGRPVLHLDHPRFQQAHR